MFCLIIELYFQIVGSMVKNTVENTVALMLYGWISCIGLNGERRRSPITFYSGTHQEVFKCTCGARDAWIFRGANCNYTQLLKKWIAQTNCKDSYSTNIQIPNKLRIVTNNFLKKIYEISSKDLQITQLILKLTISALNGL